jgi:hypothetical protein
MRNVVAIKWRKMYIFQIMVFYDIWMIVVFIQWRMIYIWWIMISLWIGRLSSLPSGVMCIYDGYLSCYVSADCRLYSMENGLYISDNDHFMYRGIVVFTL